MKIFTLVFPPMSRVSVNEIKLIDVLGTAPDVVAVAAENQCENGTAM